MARGEILAIHQPDVHVKCHVKILGSNLSRLYNLLNMCGVELFPLLLVLVEGEEVVGDVPHQPLPLLVVVQDVAQRRGVARPHQPHLGLPFHLDPRHLSLFGLLLPQTLHTDATAALQLWNSIH